MMLLNKFLPLLVLPFGIVCLLVVLALWRKKWWPGVLALAVLYLCSNPLVANFLTRRLESRYPRLAVAAAGPADAVVVLGGALGYLPPNEHLDSWFQNYERVDAALALLRAGRVPRVVFTGGRLPWDKRSITEGGEFRRLVIHRGVPEDKVMVTRVVANTADEARAVAELMRTEKWRRVILVTSAWHMPRSMLLFRQAGVDCQPFPVEQHASGGAVAVADFIPQAWAWQRTERTLREAYGWLFYRIFG